MTSMAAPFNEQVFMNHMGLTKNSATDGETPNPVPSLDSLKTGLAQELHNRTLFNTPDVVEEDKGEESPADTNGKNEVVEQLKVDQMTDLLKASYQSRVTMNIPPKDLETELAYMMNLKPADLVKRFEDIFEGSGKQIAEAANQHEYIDLYRKQLGLPDTDETREILSKAFPGFYKDSIMTRVVVLAGEKAKLGTEEFTREEIESLINLQPSNDVAPGKMNLSQISASTDSLKSNSQHPDEDEPPSAIGSI